MTSKTRCCDIDNVFGYNLKQGVIFVGFTSLVISMVAMFSSVIFIINMASLDKFFNNNPVMAINMICALFCTSTSLYQIVISFMLLWFVLWDKGSPFLMSLWFMSHISILTLYCLVLTAKAVVCLNAKQYAMSLFTAICGVIYNVIFIYFCVIVNSYNNSIDPDVTYF